PAKTGNWRRMAAQPRDKGHAAAWRCCFLARKASGNGMMNHFFCGAWPDSRRDGASELNMSRVHP
ncbi:MAG: hypothetical protein RSF79_14310, partial [Janthinobacterium sp.]